MNSATNKGMKRILCITLILLLGAGAALAQDLGTSAGHDLDALWGQAQAQHDLDREDAVILLESRQVTVRNNGDVATRVHRVVWIRTALGIRYYADLRVPWNSATSGLEVEVLRTWMDGRWWPDAERLSESAIVHTLPYAVRNAYDYGAMRETMLLHDGVELPCIMETAYTITERGLPGADGVFVLTQQDPAMLVELTVQAPADREVHRLSLNGAPAARADSGSWTWSLADAPAQARPHLTDPAASEPTAVWSTWVDHDALVASWRDGFDNAAGRLDIKAMGETLQEHLRPAAGAAARVRGVTTFVAATVATTDHDDGFWRFAPRPAARVWDSGYGHSLDLAVLTAGILRGLDFEVLPVFACPASSRETFAVPTSASLDQLMLVVTAPGETGTLIVDPAHGAVQSGSGLAGRVMVPMQTPFALPPSQPANSRLTVTLVLEPGADGAWQGSGEVSATGLLSFGSSSAAGSSALADRVAAVTGSILPDAASSECGVSALSATAISAEFALALPAADPEEPTVRWTFGAPRGGVLDALPADVGLTDASREAPVLVTAPLDQTVVAKVKLGDLRAAHLPANGEMSNSAGSFKVVTEVKDGWLHYHRELRLNGGPHLGAQWPQLRALLLEEDDAANGTIVLEPANTQD